MSNSKLVSKTALTSVNYDKGRNGCKIKKITVHHCAGVMSIDSIAKFFKNGSRQVSAHYGIGNDGKIVQCVDESNTAWTDGNWNSNCTSVTIETSNNKTGGQWTVSDSALNSLIKLVADIAKRNNLGTLVVGKNLTYHSMYAATACPGPYLKGKMSYIASEANKINSTKPAATTTTKTSTTSKSIDTLAKEVIAGKHGNGEARKKSLGSLYDKVQARVNEILYGKKPATTTKKTTTTTYTVGDYKTLDVMRIRTGAGTNYRQKLVKELTADGKRNATSSSGSAYACYKKGTIFTAQKILKDSKGNIWAKSPSGYICIKQGTAVYCKKI